VISLTARLSPSALDTRRGVVRLHPEVLDALGLRQWDAVKLTGSRVSAALAAANDGESPHGIVYVDDVTLSNLGIVEGSEIVVAPVEVSAARSIVVTGSRLASASVHPDTLRLALTGKVLTTGDAVSLLPQDLAPPPGADVSQARRQLSLAIGTTWTNELITVTATQPHGPVTIGPSSVLTWRGTEIVVEEPEPEPVVVPVEVPQVPPVPVADLVGQQDQAKLLTEWLNLTFHRPELLAQLGASAQLGVLISGPEGVGKATLARAVAQTVGASVVELSAPSIAALEANAAAKQLLAAIGKTAKHSVLLISDIDALLPTTPPPVATIVLDTLRAAIRTEGLALVVTSAHPEAVDPRLRAPELVDRTLSLPLPDAKVRVELLRVLLREVPVESDVDLGEVADRTPGFVAADLAALRREAALRAAMRHSDGVLQVSQQDLLGALETVRPISMSTSDTLQTGGLTLDDVGDMSEVKQALTEAVLWPLQYPDSFARLGVAPPRGVLMYGPPGCGKTFLVRALAGSGRLNVLSVKGAELMDKFVGESERAVRELFRRAAEAAPTLVFLDEVDALAPRRGQSSDSGVADRVVAALLTELDGVEPLRDVIVVGATNRPELLDPALLRPGRLERVIYVPPPDGEARAEILRSASKNMPLAADVDLAALADELDGYSAADCAGLVREAALTAMRESLSAAEVTAAHLAKARTAVRPSLDPAQLAQLAAYADSRKL
jgi:transitional endoplasmic reticulum ATPase